MGRLTKDQLHTAGCKDKAALASTSDLILDLLRLSNDRREGWIEHEGIINLQCIAEEIDRRIPQGIHDNAQDLDYRLSRLERKVD